jgi:hypothetical protein
MKKIILCSLFVVGATVYAEQPVAKRGRLSRCYKNTYNILRTHKGKTCFVAGAVGATVVNRVFEYEMRNYVKPLIKSVGSKVYNFFKRIFRSDKRA